MRLKHLYLVLLMGFWGSNSLAQWVPIGPGPVLMEVGNSPPADTNVKGITGNYPSIGNNPATGAVMYELPMPNDPNTFFLGSLAGGVWQSNTNSQGKTTWTPIGDNLGSLSIGAMAFNNTISKDLWVGAGNQSAFTGSGGPLTGLMVYDTSSKTWRIPSGNSVLVNQDITQVSAYGNSIVVGTKGLTTNQNLWVSTDGGSKFVPISAGLNAGEITSLVRDPTNANRLYAAVSNTADLNNTGVYRSIDGGLSWEKLTNLNVLQNTSAGQQMTATIRLSIANDGVLIADLANPVIGAGGVQGALGSIKNTAVAVYRTSNQGNSWTSMGTPTTNETVNGQKYIANLYSSGQYSIHGRVLVDPNNSSVIYISGDAQGPEALIQNGITTSIGGSTYSGRLFRGNYDPITGLTTWTPITDNFANRSGPHADSRFMMIDSQGNLIQADDAGIYKLSNPQNSTGIWQSSNFNLQIGEVHNAGWNALTHTAVTSTQDNGAAAQNKANASPFIVLSGGDGGVAAVNSNIGAKQAALYTSSNELIGLTRTIVNSSNEGESYSRLQPYYVDANGTTKYLSNAPQGITPISMPFVPLMVLNANDKSYFSIGGFESYVGQDDLAKISSDSNPIIPLSVSQVANINSSIRSMAYGAANPGKKFALLTGTGTYDNNSKTVGYLYYNNDATSSTPLTNLLYTTASENSYGIQATLFDSQKGTDRIYFSTGTDIIRAQIVIPDGETDAGLQNIMNINGNLNSSTFIYRRGLDQIYKYGVSALVAGGVNSNPTDPTNVKNYIYTLRDPANVSTFTWDTRLGSLPNAPIYGLQYSFEDDVLLVSTLGRGVFMLPDVTTYFTEATELVFGQANNDSLPSNAQLKNGLDINNNPFNRKLTKTGTGTLTLVGLTGEYALGTFLNGGTTVVDANANLGVAGTRVTFDGGTLKYFAAFALDRPITLNTGGGTIDTNALGITQGNQAIDGVGQFAVTGAGTYTFAGANTYSGGTLVMGSATVGAQQDSNFGTAGTAVTLDSGKIKYNSAFALDRAIVLNAGGGTVNTNLLGITQGNAAISGTGALSIAGGGTYTFEGANTYVGGTIVTDSSTINAQQDTNLGSSFSKLTLSNGTVNLLPSYTAYEAGKLNRPLGVIGSSNVLNTSNNAFAYTGGEISGMGILSFQGTPMTMGADLKLNAYWNANFAVPSGLVLRGVGGVIGNLTVNGTLYPGNSPGTFTVAGSVVQSPGSSFAVDIDGSGTGNGIGNYSRLVITGAGNSYTANGPISPILRNMSGDASNLYSPPVGQGFVVVSAPGSIIGSYTSLTQPSSGLLPGTRFDTVYGSNAITLYSTPKAYANLSAAGLNSNSNRQQLGGILDQFRYPAGIRPSSATLKTLYDGLYPQNASTLPVAMDQLAGVGYAQLLQQDIENTKFLIDQTLLEVGTLRRGEGKHLLTPVGGRAAATDSKDTMDLNASSQEQVWSMAVGRISTVQNDGTGYQMNNTLGGLLGGMQKQFNPQTLAGVSLAYADSYPSISQNLGSGPIQNLQVMGYASQTSDPGYFVQGAIGGGVGQIFASRSVSFLNAGYKSTIRTGNLAASGLAGWASPMRDDAPRVELGVGINYLTTRNLGFTDTGNLGAYTLNVGSTTNNSLSGVISGVISSPAAEVQGIHWRTTAFASAAYEFDSTYAILNTSFMNQSMQIQSGSIGRTRGNVGLGLTGEVTQYTSIAFNVFNQFAKNWNATAAGISLRIGF